MMPRSDHSNEVVISGTESSTSGQSMGPILFITKTPSSGFRSNVTLLLPGRLLNPASSSLPHVADFNGIRHGWDLRDPQSSGRLRHPPKTRRFRPSQIIAKRQPIELVFDPPERNVFGTGASRRPRFRRDATSTHTASAHDKRESESFLVVL